MRINQRSQTAKNSGAIQLLLLEAKKLHRAATSDSKLKALPVLRRLITTQVIRELSLAELYRKSDLVQRKHILNMLGIEAGYAGWATYKQVIESTPADKLEHSSIVLRKAGYPNLWFSSLSDAEQYSSAHGGQVFAIGQQAVVIPETY